MGKFIIVFLLFFLLFYFGIMAARMLSGKETWELTKMLMYSFFCAMLTGLTLLGIVILF